MVVTVLIKRRIKAGRTMEVFALLNKLRGDAVQQRGYVAGRTLIDQNDPQKVVVVSEWIGLENWHEWKENPVRIANEAKLQPYLEGPTEIEEYSLATHHTLKKKAVFVDGSAAERTMPGAHQI
jgi:heme-degrading monooxygenase HmoA